jgi:outer membrane lipoprotein carrier protein
MKPLFRVLALCFTLVPAAQAGAPSPSNSQELVAEVKRTYSGTTSIRAEFVQVARNTVTGKQQREKGKISLERPRKMRLEMGVPLQQLLVSDGYALWLYSVRDKLAMQVQEQASAGGMGVLLDDLSRIDEVFKVELLPSSNDRVVAARLTPRTPGAYTSLELTFSRKRYELEKLVLTGAAGDVTEMTFQGVKMNQDIPDQDFVFVPPAGVQVSKGAP